MINSIEVIRGNPSNPGIIGVPAGGQLLGVGDAVQRGEKVLLETGDTLRVHVGFDYSGGKEEFTLYGAIGTRHPFPLGFVEHLIGRDTVSCPASLEVIPIEDYVDILITSALATGTYDLYCKIEQFPQVADELVNVIEVTRTAVGIPWWGWAIVGVGGLAVVGGGVYIAGQAMGKRD